MPSIIKKASHVPRLVAALCILSALLILPHPVSGAGETIWGKDSRSTRRAMKQISRALGVRCKYCHAGSKYSKETPRKELARAMHYAFADSLIIKGQANLLIEGKDGQSPKHLSAIYQATADNPGILLRSASAISTEPTAPNQTINQTTAQNAGNTDSTSVERFIPFPSTGARLKCATCHQGKLNFMTETK
jgi:hypothetical protein